MNDDQESASDSADQQHASAASSQADEFVRSALASLESPPMPDWVESRIFTAIAQQSAARSTDAAAAAAPVVALAARRKKRGSRWFVAVAGVAAAGLLGVVVGRDVLIGGTEPTGPAKVSVVPMSASTMHYTKPTLVTQASKQVPSWRSAASAAAVTPLPTATASQSTDTGSVGTAGATASQTPSARTSATPETTIVPTSVRMTISTCLPAVTDRQPLHVEVAMYRDPQNQPEQQVAVVAVPATATSMDVYVMSLDCTATDPKVRAHILVQDPK
ncbi:MAG: hypothetical protein ACOYD0_05525 [Candidatus Nanopelagicales bacterium]